jgi:4-amino-4-deoxy-L-arabinose transferase-like glycosyltransferase
MNAPDSSPEKTRWEPQSLDRWDWLAGSIVLVGTFAVLMSTLDMGITRDESFYFRAAREYIGWFEELWLHIQHGEISKSFTQQNVDRYWGYNAEHPVLVKTLFALSHKLFYDQLGWLGHIEALRLPGAAFGSIACLLTYLLGRETFGRTAGFIAVGALFLQPRYFFHAHLTCFDVPVTALWVAVIYAYWKSLDSRRWAVATGLLWGLALSAKLNAFFLPIVLGLHWLVTHWHKFGWTKIDGRARLKLPPIPWAFVWMAILGPILFYVLWPRHWFDTTERVLWYINFHLKHVHYFVYYLGENWIRPPFPVAFPWVMTAVTVPATILLTFVLGIGRAAKEWRFEDWLSRWKTAIAQRRLPNKAPWDRRGTGLLIAINFIFPIALIGMPETPIFGGTKHWMPAMPFLAVISGAGAVWAIERARQLVDDEHRKRQVAAVASIVVSLAVLGPAAYATAHNHPYGTGYYNEFIGGHRGAAEAGMMRQFWGYAGGEALPFLNERAPDGTAVWLGNTTIGAWAAYKRDNWLEKNLPGRGIERSDIALYHHQRAFAQQQNFIYQDYGTMAPSRVYGVDGVPMLSVYVRPGSKAFRVIHGDASAAHAKTDDKPATAPSDPPSPERLRPSGLDKHNLPNPRIAPGADKKAPPGTGPADDESR